MPTYMASVVAVLLAGSAATAATLGPVQNPVFFGKPFVANIAVGGGSEAMTCVETKLAYGGVPTLGTYYTLSGNTLQIRNNQAINDAVVDLSVSIDCENPISRNYTMLPEAPTAVAAAVQADAIQARSEQAPKGVARAKHQPTKFGSTGNQNAFGVEVGVADYIEVQPDPLAERRRQQEQERRARQQAQAEAERAQLQAVQDRQRRLAESNRATNESSSGGLALASAQQALLDNLPEPSLRMEDARLEVDSFDWTMQAPEMLASAELLSQPDDLAREQARRAWAEIAGKVEGFDAEGWEFADVADAGRSAAASSSGDSEVAALKAQLAQEQASKRTSLLWSWALFVLALLLGLLLWLARRKKAAAEQAERQQAWWQESSVMAAVGQGEEDGSDWVDTDSSASGLKYRSKVVPQVDNYGGFVEDLPLPEVTANLSADEALMEFGLSQLDPDEEEERIRAAQAITDDLVDVRQQAEFFKALGQYDQADKLLREYLQKSPEASPLIYLDLLGIYYAAGNQVTFASLREHFNETFNAHIPDFAHFGNEGQGLEHYTRPLSRIQALWGGPEVIRMIEHSIFRRRKAEEEDVFDPLAFRDLLMLYPIALEMVAGEKDLARHVSYVQQASSWLQTQPLGFKDSTAFAPVTATLNTKNGVLDAIDGQAESVSTSAEQTPIEGGRIPADQGRNITPDADLEHLNIDLELPSDEGLGMMATVFDGVDFEIDEAPTSLEIDPETLDLELDEGDSSDAPKNS